MNTEFFVQPSNYIDRRMWVEGAYEKAQLKYMIGISKQRRFDAFVDIGANFGLYSCILGVNEAVPEVHSFECDPRNLYHLYGHIRMNNLMDTVTVHPHAAGDNECSVAFEMAPGSTTGHSHVVCATDDPKKSDGNAKTRGYKSVIVGQKPVDNVLFYNGSLLLLKIDVEGYENAVLRGMTQILKNNSCMLQIEILHDDEDTSRFLTSLGYKNVHKIGRDWYFSNILM